MYFVEQCIVMKCIFALTEVFSVVVEWIKKLEQGFLFLLNKKEIHTFAFIPAAERFHSWNPNKTASMNIVMTCFVCSEA